MVAAGEQVRRAQAGRDGPRGADGRRRSGRADHELLGGCSPAWPRGGRAAALRPGASRRTWRRASQGCRSSRPGYSRRRAERPAANGTTLIVEGVGGLLVPLSEDFTVRDLAVALGLPVADRRASRAGHDQPHPAHVEAARAAGLDVRAVVLTPWPAEPVTMERSNRETIARLGAVRRSTLCARRRPRPGRLARAGAGLPWRAGSAGPRTVPAEPRADAQPPCVVAPARRRCDGRSGRRDHRSGHPREVLRSPIT